LRTARGFSLCFVLAFAAVASAQESPLAPFKWLAQLTGACWTGTHSDGKTSDTQCYDVELRRFIRGSIAVESPGRPAFEGRGVLSWDAKRERIVFWSWASTGTTGQMEATWEGDILRYPDPRKPDPAAPSLRATWTRIDADSYRVARERREGDAWKELFAIVYKRDPGAKRP